MESVALVGASFAAAVLAGAIVFQSFFVAPSVFRLLDEQAAARMLRHIFPRLFTLGLICAASILLSLVAAGAPGSPSGRWLIAMALLMVAAQTASIRLVPLINAARDAGESCQRRFQSLHRVSVILTVGVLGLATVTLAILTRSAL